MNNLLTKEEQAIFDRVQERQYMRFELHPENEDIQDCRDLLSMRTTRK